MILETLLRNLPLSAVMAFAAQQGGIMIDDTVCPESTCSTCPVDCNESVTMVDSILAKS